MAWFIGLGLLRIDLAMENAPIYVLLKHPITGNTITYPQKFEQKHLDSAAKYQATPSDIFVCAYAKCGTTWTQNIVWLIVHNGEPIPPEKNLEDCIPMLEFVGSEFAEAIDNSQFPRIIKTHFPYQETPQNKDAKYIYITRNPKDALVSYYYHLKGFDFPDLKFDRFYDLFIESKVAFNGYFENVSSWCEQRHQPNILFLLYEDLKRDLRGNVLKIAGFLGKNYKKKLKANDGEILQKILEESSFKAMKKESEKWVKSTTKMRKHFCATDRKIPPRTRLSDGLAFRAAKNEAGEVNDPKPIGLRGPIPITLKNQLVEW